MEAVETKYKHYRNGYEVKGGATLGWTYDKDTMYIASANCSIADTFCKKTGRDLVNARLQKIKEDKQETEYSAVITLDQIKELLKSNNQRLIQDATYISFIDSLTFKDLKYEMFVIVAERVFR